MHTSPVKRSALSQHYPRGDCSIKATTLSIVIPTWNEAATICATLQSIQQARGKEVEILVVDGGSDDATLALARPLCDRVERAPRGRAAQMNAGAALARGEVLLFLHADTHLPPQFAALIGYALSQERRVWGWFNTRIDSPHLILRIVGRMMDMRSRCSGIATGDQAIFVRHAEFNRIGGFPDIPLMEDIALSKLLKRISWPVRIGVPVVTSARRWQSQGILRTIVLMWSIRWSYFRGADPASLASKYASGGRNG